MTIKSKLDPETKIELLIKLAFGIPIEDLAEEYELSKARIINLRKNNYVKYNEFFNYWRIDKSVAVLGLTPKHERALSVVKKFYKSKITIVSESSILYENKPCTMSQILDMADTILQKDSIYCFKELPLYIKNYY
nr:MAG TPA: ECF RNA polymerase sigma factor [Caudoviricetes sp.]